MKYIVMLADGMADYPVEKLGGKTPMMAAYKPNMDKFALKATVGTVKTVPDSMKPGSDVANLSAMGYDPTTCYTGRSPLEAMSIGIDMSDTDIAFRCNLVTLSEDEPYDEKTMVDYSSQEITTPEAKEIIDTLNKELKDDEIEFYCGISYRHCMIWHNGPKGLGLTPPHDISDRKITQYVPKNKKIYDLMKKSVEILKNHPVNIERKKKGLNPASAIWLWGEGTRPAIPNFKQKFGLNGTAISAVDLIKGIGITAGLDVINVEGATGNINTNFANKGKAALSALLEGKDYVYIHVEAPDECGHRGEAENKIKSIELIDRDIVGPVTKGLENAGEDYTILIMPDHPTPIVTKTHARDAVPFLIYRSNKPVEGVKGFDENSAKTTGLYVENGPALSKLFLGK
ncbi:MAG: cofactor-independent phosphoglycerate mutase [Clostridia bacterium]|jgi:2,3-bisphosphoglycerate-independent phosphoglycerate mutase|nr:cofactor-independent phosphoglycerate mutase [Clostridia bacterium]MCI1998932.1 cofactor-independent phosphoglycerate mutase [Clostridia bacterium]MCI2013682.1 cofactor-independent phosphoglycerate mutase [Clostridia bacterium]